MDELMNEGTLFGLKVELPEGRNSYQVRMDIEKRSSIYFDKLQASFAADSFIAKLQYEHAKATERMGMAETEAHFLDKIKRSEGDEEMLRDRTRLMNLSWVPNPRTSDAGQGTDDDWQLV